MREKIQDGSQVKMHFSLMLEDQTVIDTNFDKEPVCFFIGDGNLLPGFEKALIGMQVNHEEIIEVEPQEAFGQHNKHNIQKLNIANFDDDKIEIGSVYSFENGGGELPGVIVEIREDQVYVDFNHPLAGKTILFKVSILKIKNEDLG